jgi:hypothetical protein
VLLRLGYFVSTTHLHVALLQSSLAVGLQLNGTIRFRCHLCRGRCCALAQGAAHKCGLPAACLRVIGGRPRELKGAGGHNEGLQWLFEVDGMQSTSPPPPPLHTTGSMMQSTLPLHRPCTKPPNQFAADPSDDVQTADSPEGTTVDMTYSEVAVALHCLQHAVRTLDLGAVSCVTVTFKHYHGVEDPQDTRRASVITQVLQGK